MECIIYLALEDVDFSVANVQVVAHLVEFGRESVAFLSGLQGDLRLFLDESILLFQSLSQFFHLRFISIKFNSPMRR